MADDAAAIRASMSKTGDDSLDDAAAAIRASMSTTKNTSSQPDREAELDDAKAIKASKEPAGKEKEIKAPAPDVRGLGVVVLHPGSWELRVGKAWDKKPHVTKHCVARHVADGPPTATHTPQTNVGGTWTLHDALREQELLLVESRLKEEKNRARDPLDRRPPKKAKITYDGVSHLKKPSIAQMKSPPFPEPSGPKWIDASDNRQHIFGEEALLCPPNKNYELMWPLQRGHFNPKLGVATVCNLLDLIWTDAIKTKLEIPQKDFGLYAAALVVRDTINRKEVAEMVHVLLRRMRFRSVFVIQESVGAAFGSGIATACVVDLGHQTTSITCVEDGYSLPATRLEMPSGSDDVSHTLHWLLRRVGASEFWTGETTEGPTDVAGDMRLPQDALIYHKMKEELCGLPYLNIQTGQLQKTQYESRVIRQKGPGEPVLQWEVKSGTLHQVAAMSIYYPRLSEPLVGAMTTEKGQYSLESVAEAAAPAPPVDKKEDPPASVKEEDKEDEKGAEGEEVRKETEKKKSSKKKSSDDDNQNLSANHGGDGNLVPPMALEEAITMSISRVGRTELKKKLFNTVLLVGGGANMNGLIGSLEDRLIHKLEGMQTEQVESVEVLNKDTGDIGKLDKSMVSWRGAAIAAQSDAAKDMYILLAEWDEGGTRFVREKAPFGFS